VKARVRIWAAAAAGAVCLLTALGQIRRPGPAPDRIFSYTLPADLRWLDTGFDIRAGDELVFRAEGAISLQQGNPVAFPCGPEGLDLPTIQQPLRESRIGALIGRILQIVAVEVDEETGEETSTEMERFFYIGKGGLVTMPMDGQLYLGVNESVVRDNSGAFRVEMERAGRGTSRENRR
jgi:hypothetical protein